MGLERNQAFLEAFGRRVRELRLAKGLSMRALADILNVDLHHVSDVELAKRNTSIMMAYSLSKVLEVPLSELFTFEVE
jgi:transcriptional regulator with XRE-family HTH domain